MSYKFLSLFSSDKPEDQLHSLEIINNTEAFRFLPQSYSLVKSQNDQVRAMATSVSIKLAEKCLRMNKIHVPHSILQQAIEVTRDINQDWLGRLHIQLETGHQEQIIEAIIILKHFISEKRAEAFLRRFLKFPDDKIRATAVLHLGEIASKKSADILANFLKDSNNRVKANAIEVLEKIGNVVFKRILTRFKTDTNNRIRANAIKALFKMGDVDIHDDLQSMLTDTNVYMRASAIWIIGEIGQTAPYLLRLLEMVKENTQEVIRTNLLIVLRKIPEAPELEFLRLSLKEDLKNQLKNNIVRNKDLSIDQQTTRYYIKLTLFGVITAQTVLSLKLMLDDIINQENHFIMDFSEIEYIDSSGVGLLVNFQKRLTKSEGYLYIFGCNFKINELFQLSKIDTILNVFQTLDEVHSFLGLPDGPL